MLHGAGMFSYFYPINDPNVGKYSLPGAAGLAKHLKTNLGVTTITNWEKSCFMQSEITPFCVWYLICRNTFFIK